MKYTLRWNLPSFPRRREPRRKGVWSSRSIPTCTEIGGVFGTFLPLPQAGFMITLPATEQRNRLLSESSYISTPGP